MTEFDRNELAAVLRSAGIEPRDKTIRELEAILTCRQLVYWITKKEVLGKRGPSQELVDLHNSLKAWLDLCFRDFKDSEDPFRSTYEMPVVIDEYEDHEKYQAKMRSILWLMAATNQSIGLLKREKCNRPIHPKEAETYLLRRLYEDYCDFSGNHTLSDTGPQIRFVSNCAKIIDPKIVVPKRLRQRLAYYVARKKTG